MGLAAHAAVALDNARLYQASQREVSARQEAEQKLQELKTTTLSSARFAAQKSSPPILSNSKRPNVDFRLLVEGVTQYAIFMLDVAGNVVNWNPGAKRIKGYEPEEIIGQHFSKFYTEEDRNNQIPWKALETAATTGAFEAEGWRIRKDGSRFWASVVINTIRDGRGDVVGFAKVTRDLTERRKAEERLAQSQKMEGIGQSLEVWPMISTIF